MGKTQERALTGYVPETSVIYAALLRRRSEPFLATHTCRQEARQIALYLSDPDHRVEDILRAWRVQSSGQAWTEVQAIFKYWGADYHKRRLLPAD